MGRSLYVPQRSGHPVHMHDFSGAPSHADPRFGHYTEPAPYPHAPAYRPHTFNAPTPAAHTPHRQFPLGPFIIAIIVGVGIFSAWVGYHALTTPDPVNAAPPVVYSK